MAGLARLQSVKRVCESCTQILFPWSLSESSSIALAVSKSLLLLVVWPLPLRVALLERTSGMAGLVILKFRHVLVGKAEESYTYRL